MDDTESPYSPYCAVCEACGEEPCCSPLMCKQDPQGYYCERYLTDLKFTYALNRALVNYLHDKEWNPKDLKEWYDKKFDELYTTFYKTNDDE